MTSLDDMLRVVMLSRTLASPMTVKTHMTTENDNATRRNPFFVIICSCGFEFDLFDSVTNLVEKVNVVAISYRYPWIRIGERGYVIS